MPIPYTAQARDALAAAGEDSWAIIAKPLRMRTFYANLSTVANRESLAVDTGSQPQTIKSQGSATLRGTALLVEDDRINLLAISRSLAAAGCTVETAVNGQEAVDKAKNGSYDIIFMGENHRRECLFWGSVGLRQVVACVSDPSSSRPSAALACDGMMKLTRDRAPFPPVAQCRHQHARQEGRRRHH